MPDDVDPGLLGQIARVQALIKVMLEHPHLTGINRRAGSGTIATWDHIRDRLMQNNQPAPKRPFGIERSLPQGDRD